MHWRHRFPMLFIKLSDDRNRKRRPDTESGDRSWPFHSFQNRDPPDTPQQSELGEVVHYHPSEWKSLPIAAAYGRTYGSRVSSRYLRPVTVPPWNTCRSVWPPSEIPAQTRIPPPL
ncbi:hypothetical protein TNCV_2332191 [Trichonephila clavipes]|nr:hypothetical protein TNCV_2332191 [Trichonephila clavipes]